MAAEPTAECAGVWRRWDPRGAAVPLILDSPHSGTDYPSDYRHVAPRGLLRRSEDTHVDALFGDAPAHGATLLGALFPRSYIDTNRALGDLDPDMLDGPWPGRLEPGQKTALGIGLIARFCGTKEPIYDRKLTVDEVARRIDGYWRPYHAELDRLVEAAQRRFKIVFHLNCHSMPPMGVAGMAVDAGVARADFVLGDRDGTTASPDYVTTAEAFLMGRGYEVRRNDPFKGVELVRKHGQPAAGRHSLQIEVNRRLYLDEDTREPNDGFARTRADLAGLVARLAEFARAEAR